MGGVVARDLESGREYELKSRAVINATGVFNDRIRKMDDPGTAPFMRPSQGVHIVLNKSFLPTETAIMVPHTDDGRVLFAIPWHQRVLVGTTDTPVEDVSMKPVPMEHEIEFLLKHTARYLSKDPEPGDVLSMFAGLRPLVSAKEHFETATISREHTLSISRTGLITIAGGKWTTYRKMAQETVDQAIAVARLKHRPSVTETLQIHGYHHHAHRFGELKEYGTDALEIDRLIKDEPILGEPLPGGSIVRGEVIWAVKSEMARTVEDFLARRRRVLFLDARAAMNMAPAVAELMAAELKRGKDWQKTQIETFQKTARGYYP